MRRLSSLAFLAACTPATSDVAYLHGTVDVPATHVVATSAVAGDLQRAVAPVEGGAFSLAVEPGRPWTLAIVDATRRGSAMTLGVLRAGALDTLEPRDGGDIDLGELAIVDRVATSYADLATALDLDAALVPTIGGLDDLAARYGNPDLDGDGVIDPSPARLRLHAEYTLVVDGRTATADDLIARPAAIRYEHAGTGIYASLPDGAVDPATASVTFEQPFHGLASGHDTPAVPAGEPVTAITLGTDDRTFGVFARAGAALPQGTYRFRSGATTLEFAFVRPPDLASQLHQVMPRLRLVPADPACTTACRIAAIAYAWVRRAPEGWVALTDAETRALAPTATIDLLTTHAGAIRFTIPAGTARGELAWTTLYASPVTSAQIVYANIAFRTRQGMAMSASFGG